MTKPSLREIRIEEEYYEEIEKIVAQSTEFGTVSDYVNFVLKEMLFGEDAPDFSDDEEELVRKRLRDLGYL